MTASSLTLTVLKSHVMCNVYISTKMKGLQMMDDFMGGAMGEVNFC